MSGCGCVCSSCSQRRGGNNEKDKRVDILETFKLTAIDEEQMWKNILKIKIKKIRRNASCGSENEMRIKIERENADGRWIQWVP